MRRFKYCVMVVVGQFITEDVLDEMGMNGWEMTGCASDVHPLGIQHEYYFKKEVGQNL